MQPKYDAPALSNTATVVDVCAWAARGVSEGGAGLGDANVDVLRVQEIDGEVLFALTHADLEKVMVLGPRKKLLAAIERIRKLPGWPHVGSTSSARPPLAGKSVQHVYVVMCVCPMWRSLLVGIQRNRACSERCCLFLVPRCASTIAAIAFFADHLGDDAREGSSSSPRGPAPTGKLPAIDG